MSSGFAPGNPKILWINGPAGHGKSVLCARVVQHLLTTLESPLAYYFCSSESESRRDHLSIMRSWISQVISANRDAFNLSYDKWEAKDGYDASQTDIIELFKAIVQRIPNCTFVVDGLDECLWVAEKWRPNDDDSPIGFFSSLRQAVAHTTTRVLILSRDEPEIRYGLRAIFTSESNQGLTEYKICPEDIRSDALSFSRDIIDKRLATKTDTLKNELSQRIVNRCGGMFLWVKMLEEHLRSWKNKKQLEAAIDQAPTALDHIYDRNWMRISHLPDRDQLRAISILRWTAFALRPLTILEITEALLIVDDDNCEDILVDELPDTVDEDYISSEILGPCGSLLEIQEAALKEDLGSATIHFAHFSARQYILCNMPAQGGLLATNERLLASSEIFQNNVLAKLCLRYLNFRKICQESYQLDGGSLRGAFRDYAAGSWYYHYTECGSNYMEVVKLTNALFSPNSGNWESWRQWFDANDDKSNMPKFQGEISSTSPLFYASLLGLQHTIIYLFEEAKLSVNHVDEFNRTAIQAASLNGQTLIVIMLLEKGANVNVANNEGCTPLNLACHSGHVDVVNVLLKNGANVTITDKEGRTPLYSACNSGHVDLVKVLLENGANITVANNSGLTPLYLACYNGHVDIVKVLLKNGADMAVSSNKGWTPLNMACYNGHDDVVKVLLENGADVALASNDGWTPLYLACYNGHIDVVKVLLENGADITVASNEGWTPLSFACYNGHVDVVKVLLANGANVIATDKRGWTPLYSACNNGHIDVVKVLIDNGADIAVASNEGWTPLSLACCNGDIDVVKVLLENGANVIARDKRGQTPLFSACNSGHIDVVKVLIENGADITVASNSGWTPLNIACYSGHVDVVKVLLENGADVALASNNGWTPLCSACYNGHVDIVKVLLENGANVIDTDKRGRTPLFSACKSGHVDVVKVLIENGAEADFKHPQYGRTSLSYAASNGLEAVVKLLLAEDGVDGNSEDSVGRTPLSYAAESGHEMVAKMLLSNKCVNPDIKDHYGATPLSIAVRHAHTEVVKLLLSTGCVDLNSQDCFGRTPLWWARRIGNYDITQLLLDHTEIAAAHIYETDPPIDVDVIPYDKSSTSCDVCTLNILKDDAYYHCGVCNGGDFDICLGCYTIGGRCLEVNHKLAQRRDEDKPQYLEVDTTI